MEENIYSKTCIKCGKIYYSKGKAPIGECAECMSKEEYFCNKCGQPIDYYEYNSSIEGYCEECYEKYMENDEEN